MKRLAILTSLLMIEALILAGLGGAAGMALASVGLNRLPTLLPQQAAQFGFELQLGTTAIAYCIAAAFLSGERFGRRRD